MNAVPLSITCRLLLFDILFFVGNERRILHLRIIFLQITK